MISHLASLMGGIKSLLKLALHFVKSFFLLLGILFAMGIIAVVAVFYFFQSQFDFDGASSTALTLSSAPHSGPAKSSRKYVRKSSSVPTPSLFKINLQETRLTVSFHSKNLFTVECEVDQDQDLLINHTQDHRRIEIKNEGFSNCEFTFPETSTFELFVHQGRVAIDRPPTSFSIEGDDVNVTWIKNMSLKFKIFYTLPKGNTEGNIDDIFDPQAPREGRINLRQGSIVFFSPHH